MCNMQNPKEFTSSTTKLSTPIISQTTSNSSNIIYQLLPFKHYPKDYMGLTSTPLNLSINNHLFMC